MDFFSNINKKRRIFLQPELISRHLFCCICQDVFLDPVRTQCGHTFCYLCIQQWAALKKHCPICKTSFGNRGLEKDLIASNLVDDLEVKCMHFGCDWKGTESMRNKHQKCCILRPKKEQIQQTKKPMCFQITDVDETINENLLLHAEIQQF